MDELLRQDAKRQSSSQHLNVRNTNNIYILISDICSQCRDTKLQLLSENFKTAEVANTYWNSKAEAFFPHINIPELLPRVNLDTTSCKQRL